MNQYYDFLLSENTKEKSETAIIWIAILSFLTHLAIIGAINSGLFGLSVESELLTNPISAIYTPFTFILLFEVYLLVYHLPLSTSDYIAKQYEIITLIVIRRIFKDLANLDLSINWFEDKYDLQFTYDIVTTLILFVLIYCFHKLNGNNSTPKSINNLPVKVQIFIKRKKIMASLLVPVIVIMAIYSFMDWISGFFIGEVAGGTTFVNLNNIFFDEFFTVLILTDVLLLLFSFFHTTTFHRVIRNSGFIISTILIRISFSVDGFLNNILIIVAVLFGVLILWLNEWYMRLKPLKEIV